MNLHTQRKRAIVQRLQRRVPIATVLKKKRGKGAKRGRLVFEPHSITRPCVPATFWTRGGPERRRLRRESTEARSRRRVRSIAVGAWKTHTKQNCTVALDAPISHF